MIREVKRISKSGWLLGIALCCSVILPLRAQEVVSEVQVIVSDSINLDELSAAQLRRIFTMRQRQWPSGEPIKVYVLPNQDPLHQHFTKSQLSMFPYQLERLWNKLVYSGLSERPLEVYSQDQMLKAIGATPGAIGYLSKEIVLEGRGVKKLSVVKGDSHD
ncbi:hypothetical protein [Bowmanella dokdonensis]|uniref:PBP domain-containing protein n=1 Tax=Bowmanella dokdonensis TaxID=751969 RepID=A0A939DJ51_9ALTE|nr:hypothetical protein [Bowmanella dokdonensis]MBN7823597.1 hypothetical protein [Bowmanella dokdonensis]